MLRDRGRPIFRVSFVYAVYTDKIQFLDADTGMASQDMILF